MGAVTTADQVVREDLSNLFINLDERETPFLTKLKRGEDLANVKLFSWALEKYDGRMIVGIPENKDADEFETGWQEFHNNTGRNGSSRQWMRLGNLSERVAELFDLEGPNHLVATTCSAGNHAIAWSAELLRSRAADAMLAVAADTIGFVDMLGFSRLLLQAPERSETLDPYVESRGEEMAVGIERAASFLQAGGRSGGMAKIYSSGGGSRRFG